MVAANADPLELLSNYLSVPVPTEYSRQRCPGCHASVTIYCSDCLEVFLPRDDWPASVRDQRLSLPFDLDILLDDRRASSTGVHVATILKVSGRSESCRLISLADDEPQVMADYDDGETFLLFPDVTSVPLSSVATTSRIRRLVVLDCKWSRFSKTLTLPLHQSLRGVPRVRLDPPPAQSFYWRWHNAGDGAVSTVEAVYYAAWQLLQPLPSPPPPPPLPEEAPSVSAVAAAATSPADDLLDLFWLFRLQRNIIAERYTEEAFLKYPAVPFSKEGKEYQRSLRRR